MGNRLLLIITTLTRATIRNHHDIFL